MGINLKIRAPLLLPYCEALPTPYFVNSCYSTYFYCLLPSIFRTPTARPSGRLVDARVVVTFKQHQVLLEAIQSVTHKSRNAGRPVHVAHAPSIYLNYLRSCDSETSASNAAVFLVELHLSSHMLHQGDPALSVTTRSLTPDSDSAKRSKTQHRYLMSVAGR